MEQWLTVGDTEMELREEEIYDQLWEGIADNLLNEMSQEEEKALSIILWRVAHRQVEKERWEQ